MSAKNIYSDYSKQFTLNQLITFRGNYAKHKRKFTLTAWHMLLNTRTLLSEVLNPHQIGATEERVFSAMQEGTN